MRETCLVCGSRIEEIIDMGSHPFADTFISQENYGKPDLVYPLVVALCKNKKCGHVQTVFETDPISRYCDAEYSYTSSNSTFSKNHWTKFASEIKKRAKTTCMDWKVLEVGSNDGFLLERFLKDGPRVNVVLGVDPSPNMCDLAYSRGIATVKDLFTASTAKRVSRLHGKFNVVVANNVFNHSDHPVDFLNGIKEVLRADGMFVFEVPYWLESVQSRRLDQIYHEHISYFSVKSIVSLLSGNGLEIEDIELVNYHGGSLRVFAKHGTTNKIKDKINYLIQVEEDLGLFEEQTYQDIRKQYEQRRALFNLQITEAVLKNQPVVLVGAAAKANTLINYCRLDRTLITYVTDASIYKKDKFTPLSRIPIVGDDVLSYMKNPVVSILAWNIEHLIKDKLLEYNKDIKFISF